VTRNDFAAFLRFGKDERGLRGWDERYKERLKLSDAEINARALLRHTPGMEEELLDAEQKEMLWKAIEELPEIQRRRLLMYYFEGLTFEKIAVLEGRHWTSISESVRTAEEKIQEKIKS